MRTILLVAVALFLAGCNATEEPPATTTPASTTPTPIVSSTPPVPPATEGDDNKVEIEDFAFAPPTLTVARGATVEWSNKDDAPHTVTSDTGAFNSTSLAKSAEFTHTFLANGTFPYHCAIHSNMKGTIVVGDGIAPTPATPPVTPPATPPTGATPADVTVDIHNFNFIPADIAVPVGTRVVWKNQDSSGHTATANDGSFNTGRIAAGASASHVMTSAGAFGYVCAFHSDMTGTITVTSSS